MIGPNYVHHLIAEKIKNETNNRREQSYLAMKYVNQMIVYDLDQYFGKTPRHNNHNCPIMNKGVVCRGISKAYVGVML